MKKDKYSNDRYDRELYIPKGYILPDGTKLTKKYARLHEDMAKKFINIAENTRDFCHEMNRTTHM